MSEFLSKPTRLFAHCGSLLETLPWAILLIPALFGLWGWPPVGMEIYAPIEAVSGLTGPQGMMVRITLGIIIMLAWLCPSRGSLRAILNTASALNAGFIGITLMAAPQWIMGSLWLLMGLYCMAIAWAAGFEHD